MARTRDLTTNPVPSLLTETEYNALVPTLKEAYDKVYGEGLSRKHHPSTYPAAKRVQNTEGTLAKRFALMKE